MKNIKLSPLFIVYVFFFSCQRDVSFSENKNEIPESIILKLQANGFVTSRGLAKYREGYLVEYDIYLTKSEINNLSDSKGKSSGSRIEQYRSNNLVSASRVIRVYMDPLFGVFMQNAFNTALGRYNQLNLCLRFERTTSTLIEDQDIRISTFFENSDLLGFSAGFPVNGEPAKTISLNTFHYNDNTQRGDAISTIAHEIGHAIGFRHTDFMNRAFSGCLVDANNPADEGLTNVGAVHILGTPLIPVVGSWMLACSNNTDRPFTPEDIVALTSTYNQVNYPLYAVQNSRLHGIDINGNYKTIGLPNWLGTEAMTSLNNRIYIIENSRLYSIDRTFGTYVQLGGTAWFGTDAMTSLNNFLYIVENSRLYQVSPIDGSYVQLGGAVWAGTDAITALNGSLYIVENSRLYRVNPVDGSYAQLGGAVWAGTNAMTSFNGSLYIIENSRLYLVNPVDGSYTQLGGVDWNGTNAMSGL